ncbi:MAG: N-acetylneuraminate synthase family protein, partial [bacterium]|nr:N-acetylneuraminate synthase family protein [bacterium]
SGKDKFKIQEVSVGRGIRPYILAEIGINHNGDIELAGKLIRAAKLSGADGVKFQTFKAADLAHPAKQPEYFKLFSKVELDRDAHVHLRNLAESLGIAFISTPFGIPEADMLMEIGVLAIKIASGDITNNPLLKHVGGLNVPVILSTGMSDLEEVHRAREVLLNAGCDEFALLHCVSRYPAVPQDVNFRAIETMSREFPEVIGFSDHTEGIWAAPAAVAMGASFIEKHFTLDKSLPGPDQILSTEPDEMKALIDSCRKVFAGLGDGVKRPTTDEMQNRKAGRKGIYAARDLKNGATIQFSDLKFSRPEGEISATEYQDLIGGTITCDIKSGDEISWEVIGVRAN